ncbi:MAG: hypothetical protein IJQ28_08530, partial [Clostridia bacterium]|nr:hypothetical protein [Clostridia bacterium]
SLCDDVEFSAIDATRSEKDFLYSVITVAIKSGAKNITVCDNAGEMMPDEFKYFIKDLYDNIPELKNVNLGIECSDQLHMAAACMISSVDAGVTTLKTTINGEVLPALDAFSKILRARGDSIGIYSDINYNDLETTTEKLLFSTNSAAKGSSLFKNRIFTDEAADITLNKDDDIKTVAAVVKKLGYDLSDEDISNVYEAFSKVAVKKNINARELDTIIASSALQVAPTYKIKSFLINSGNIITASAHIVLEKNGEEKQAVCIGDGPIDAAFITIEKIVDRHFELDDFQIQSVTEGREAVGSALVKLRAHGKLYSGKGISTDIIGASINAYINAINKIFFEEM